MDPILEFFLDGVCPQTIEDYAHYLSYVPEFAQRCNWKRLNDLVFLIKRPSQAVESFAWWLLDSSAKIVTIPNALFLLNQVQAQRK